MIGRTLSHYRITAKLGEGGMGVVYLAEDTTLKRQVALKILPPELAEDPERLARFRREAESIAALNHPNIVTLHSVEEAEGLQLLTMERVEGRSLGQVLPPSGFELDRLLPLGAQIAEGLAAAHERGIVHRDLKPANIMVTDDGRVKILDFGLAKLATEPAGDEKTLLMTGEGMLVGTAPYMSPEQAQGQAVDARTDIFSLGIVLYEMATGERPFKGANPASVISSILKETAPPVTTLRRELPNHLGRVIRRCLEKEPRRRFQTARDVQLELEGLGQELAVAAVTKLGGEIGTGGPGPQPPARRRTAWLPWLVAAAAVAAAVFLASIALRPAPEPPVILSRLPPPPGLLFNAVHGPPVLSPDGRRIAFLAAGPGEPSRLFWQRLDGLEAVEVQGTSGARAPFWSPDGESLAFFAFAENELRRVDLAGGEPRKLFEATFQGGGSWSRDGRILFSGTYEGPPTLIDAEDGTLIRQLEDPYDSLNAWFFFPTFLPDSRKYLFSLQDLAGGHSGISLGSLEPKEPTQTLTRRVSCPVYVDPGRLLFWEDGAIVQRTLDLTKPGLEAGSQRIVDGVSWGQYMSCANFSVSQTGLLVYLPGEGAIGDTELVRVDRQGRELAVVAPLAEYYNLRLSWDGERVAVDSTDVQTTHGDIWIYDVASGRRTLISREPVDESNPVWLPDDSAVFFLRSYDIFRRDAAAARPDRPVLQSEAFKEPEDISADGRYLLFENEVDQNTDLWVLNLETGKAKPWLEGPSDERNGDFAPNGRWIAYESDVTGRTEIEIRSFPDLEERIDLSVGGGEHPNWSRDGSELFYYVPDRQELVAVSVDWSGSRPRFGPPQTLFRAPIRDGFDVFPDSESFLINRMIPETREGSLVLIQNWEQLAGKPAL